MRPKTLRGLLADRLRERTGMSERAIRTALACGGPRMAVLERIWNRELPQALADLGLTEIPVRGVVALPTQAVTA